MMKKVARYIAVSLLLIQAVACNDWLDVKPKSEVQAEEQFKTEGGFKDALIGAYLGMTEEALYAKDMSWHFVDILAQQYELVPTSSNIEIMDYNFNDLKVSPRIEQMWLKAYNVVANINQALKYMEKNREVLHPANYAIIKGEFLALRVYLHLDLMRLFGYGNLTNRMELLSKKTIPYVTEVSKQVPLQRSYQETFALMNRDLNDAIELLKADPFYKGTDRPMLGDLSHLNIDGFYDSRMMRMNYYAALALKARLALWEGNTTVALQAANEVIGQMPNNWIVVDNLFGALQNRDLTFSTEHIFCLNVVKLDKVNNYLDKNKLGGNTELLSVSMNRLKEIYELSDNIGVSDWRYMYVYDKENEPCVSRKLMQPEGYKSEYANRLPMIKLSEIYYIAAECLLNDVNLNTALARDYLNLVREHRGITVEIAENADVAMLNEEIVKEYRKEFVGEGQLFYFYKRKGIAYIPGTSVELTDARVVLPYPDVELDFGQKQ